MKLAGVTRQAYRFDVVIETDCAAELHQCDVVVKQCVIVVRMDDDLGQSAFNLMNIRSGLSLSSKVESI